MFTPCSWVVLSETQHSSSVVAMGCIHINTLQFVQRRRNIEKTRRRPCVIAKEPRARRILASVQGLHARVLKNRIGHPKRCLIYACSRPKRCYSSSDSSNAVPKAFSIEGTWSSIGGCGKRWASSADQPERCCRNSVDQQSIFL